MKPDRRPDLLRLLSAHLSPCRPSQRRSLLPQPIAARQARPPELVFMPPVPVIAVAAPERQVSGKRTIAPREPSGGLRRNRRSSMPRAHFLLWDWLRQRRRALDDLAAGEVASAMGHQLGHEMLRVGCQKPLRIPRDMRPPADRRAAMNQRNRADAVTWHTGIRGKDCNRVVGRR